MTYLESSFPVHLHLQFVVTIESIVAVAVACQNLGLQSDSFHTGPEAAFSSKSSYSFVKFLMSLYDIDHVSKGDQCY